MIYRASIFIVLFCAWCSSVMAQFPSACNRFQVDRIKGCTTLDVTITVNAAPTVCNGNPVVTSICDAANPCLVDWGEGAGFEAFTTFHTYTTSGLHTLSVVFGSSGDDQIIIETLPNIQPEFEIYRCNTPANNIIVNVTDQNYDEYVIEYSDGTSVVVPVGAGGFDTHDFGSPGAKTVSVRGRKTGFEDNCSALVKPIDIAPGLTDAFIQQLTVLDGSRIQLDFTHQPFTSYQLEVAVNSTTFTATQGIYNEGASGPLTIDNLLTNNNFYCFRIGTVDGCSGAIVGYSNVICSADFDAAAQNGFNRLTWNTDPTGVAGYSISKSEGSNVLTPLTASPPSLTTDDTDVTCFLTYTYQFTTNYADGSVSISPTRTATAFSTTPPATIANISTIVNEGSVSIEWQQDPAFNPKEYSVFKAANGFTALFAKTTVASVTDATYNTMTPTCYIISYEDFCNNKSALSAEACPIQLAGTLQPDNSIILAWNDYGGWINGIDSYALHKYDGQGQLIQTFTSIPSATFTDNVEDPDNQVYTYVVEAIGKDPGITSSVSNRITIIKESNVFYPTAFTPDGDALNDVFTLGGQFIAAFEMKIFNRWGELLFATEDIATGWDGTTHGQPVPEGTYVFSALITDDAGRTFTRSSSIVLLRKR